MGQVLKQMSICLDKDFKPIVCPGSSSSDSGSCGAFLYVPFESRFTKTALWWRWMDVYTEKEELWIVIWQTAKLPSNNQHYLFIEHSFVNLLFEFPIIFNLSYLILIFEPSLKDTVK